MGTIEFNEKTNKLILDLLYIPFLTGHLFRSKLDSISVFNWTPIPEITGR